MTFPSRSKPNTRTIFEGRVLEVTGLPTVYGIPSTSTVLIPVDVDGLNPVYTNNQSFLYIYKGGILQTGWSIQSGSATNCGWSWGTESNQTYIRVVSITADTGYVDIIMEKTGESDLILRVNFVKQYAGLTGVTGATGATGAAGSQGITGAAGSDGTGLVVIRRDIEIIDPTQPTTADQAGNFRFTFSAVHGLATGDRLHIFNAGYSQYATVTNVISTLIVDTDLAYISGSYDVRDMKHFCKDDNYGVYNGNGGQIIEFPNLIPVDVKLIEMHVRKTSGDPNTIQLSAGQVANPTTGWFAYLSSKLIQNVGDIESCMYPNLADGYIVDSADSRRDLYFYGVPYYTLWENGLDNDIYKVQISYINYVT